MIRELEYDVVIAGGGIAGVAAAVASAGAGAKTVLVERNAYLGGEATHSMVTAFCGFYATGRPPVKAVAGVGDLVLEQLGKLGQETGYEISASGSATIKFHPEYLKYALDLLTDNWGVDVLFHSCLTSVQRNGGSIESVECADDAGRFRITGKAFVDATGDANLAFLSGAGTVWGNQEGRTQAATLAFMIDRIGGCGDITPDAIEKAVLRAKKDGTTCLTKEKGFIIRRGNADYGYVLLPSAELTGLDAASLTAAEQDTRRQAHAYVEAFRRYMPGMEKCRLMQTGPGIGIRESRKLAGRYTLCGADVLEARKRPDGIGRGAWRPEIHRDINKMGEYLKVEEGSYYDIPLAALRSADTDNLYGAGRVISADDVAFASARVMGTCFVTGQGAGTGAAMQALGKDGSIDGIRQELLRQGALL